MDEIPHQLRNPGMLLPCTHPKAMVSAVVSKRCEMDVVHPRHHGFGGGGAWHFSVQKGLGNFALLGPPLAPFFPFFWEGSPAKIDKSAKSWYPYFYPLKSGGPRLLLSLEGTHCARRIWSEQMLLLKADTGALAWMADVDADRPEERRFGHRKRRPKSCFLGSLKDRPILQPLETRCFCHIYKWETTIYKAMFRCIMQGSLQKRPQDRVGQNPDGCGSK